MIDPLAAKVGFHVFYQQQHMNNPEYGIITSVEHAPRCVHVRFMGETTAKACRPHDLHWPPDFCAADRANPEGQVFGPSCAYCGNPLRGPRQGPGICRECELQIYPDVPDYTSDDIPF